jgi:hypothetical protein
MKYYDDIVVKMLGLGQFDIIPYELLDKLEKINDLCEKAGGMLASRQTIAIIVNDYLEKHKGE